MTLDQKVHRSFPSLLVGIIALICLMLIINQNSAAEIKQPSKKTKVPPLCQSSSEMKGFDKQRVRLVGIYKKKMSRKKMNSPEEIFLGYVQIEVKGNPKVIDSSNVPAKVTPVLLGMKPRSADEIKKFNGKRVIVEGRLLLAPEIDEGQAEYAREDPKPTLVHPKKIKIY